ncbi:Tn3 family transposase, partial [Brucella intermedia]|uniref:Tn3 family transposase n=1 Tax=Brucella intermedia TaxID=94625 RepID=UPI00235F28C3
MPRRIVLTARQRSSLFDLPTDEASLLKYYTLADDDIAHIRTRRKARNRLGFALQLCAFRYPGRLLTSDDIIPAEMVKFIAAQLGMQTDDLDGYAIREETRREHLLELRALYEYRTFTGRTAGELRDWLYVQAEDARSNEDLAHRFVERCRQTEIIVPAISTIERLCADALVAAERRVETRIVERLDMAMRARLDELLTETVEGHVSRFIWIRKFEIGNNSADANHLLDRLEFLQKLDLDAHILAGTPPHRITRLRRQGERYFTDGLLDINADRRLAILAVCVVEWRAAIADTLVETHDRIVGKTWREAKRLCDGQASNAKTAVTDTLRAFSRLGAAVLEAHNDGRSLEKAITTSPGWPELEKLVATASQLTDTMSADPISHVAQGYNRFRRYAPRMLRCLEIKATPAAEPLMAALTLIRNGEDYPSPPRGFVRPASNWSRLLKATPNDRRLWEVAVLFHLRDAFRSADIWLDSSRRYADLRETLVPMATVKSTARLAIPFEPGTWLADRKARMADGLKRLAKAVRFGSIPKGSIEDGTLRIERLTAAVPEDAEELILDLYRRMPEVRITDILLEVDKATGFGDAFTHLRTGAPCNDRIGLLNVLLAEGLNLGLRKMAEASNTHDYWQLSRLSRWHVESDAINHALAMVVAAQGRLPISQFWGLGETASSDGPFFPAARQGKAMNLINAKYGSEPGLKA